MRRGVFLSRISLGNSPSLRLASTAKRSLLDLQMAEGLPSPGPGELRFLARVAARSAPHPLPILQDPYTLIASLKYALVWTEGLFGLR